MYLADIIVLKENQPGFFRNVVILEISPDFIFIVQKNWPEIISTESLNFTSDFLLKPLITNFIGVNMRGKWDVVVCLADFIIWAF